MAVSQNWRNLRDFLRRYYNKEVNEWFRDEPDQLPDNSTSRKQAKRACLIMPKDSQNIALLKTLNFRFVIQQSHLAPDVYGVPISNFDAVRKHRPQIWLEFKEDALDVEGGYSRLRGAISYRLMEETTETISKTELTTIANRIRTEFGVNNGYIWKKGKDLASYVNKEKGYQFQLLVRNKTDAKELITKVLNTNNSIPNWKYLSYKESDNPTQAYPTIPDNQIILGKTVRQPRKRPVGDVRFQYGYCSLWGNAKPIVLYDRSFRYNNTLI